MRIGLPRETKPGERRVSLLPPAVAALVRGGHRIEVESGAGAGIGADNEAYAQAGAQIVSAAEAWGADLVVKVKEIQDADWAFVPDGSCIFCFHHLAGEPARTHALAARHVTAIAFEMLRDAVGGFPLLAPMSEIAGRLAVEAGARLLGRLPGSVLVLGAGHAGLAAARTAASMGCKVVILTRSTNSRAAATAAGFAARLADPAEIEREALRADLVVGAVFVPAQPTPKLLPRALVARMRRGAVIADISIDAGGVAETSRPTTHAEPAFVEEGVVHYCVTNIPAAAPLQAAAALSAALLPYVDLIAWKGLARALRDDPALRGAALLWRGRVNDAGIAAEARLPYTPISATDLE
ncbi:MAG: FAD-binding protein [Usitatibacter sp.]